MAKIGTKKRPIIARVHSAEKAKYVAETCAEHGWYCIIGFELDKPEDTSDLEKALNPPKPIESNKINRNDLCPCGSGKKYKNVVVRLEQLKHEPSPDKSSNLTQNPLPFKI